MGRAPIPKPPEPPGWLRWLLEHLKPVGRFFDWVTEPDAGGAATRRSCYGR